MYCNYNKVIYFAIISNIYSFINSNNNIIQFIATQAYSLQHKYI